MRALSAAFFLILCGCAADAPKPVDWQAERIQVYDLGSAAHYREALAPARRERAGAEQALPPASPELAGALMDLAYVERESGAYADAAAHYRRALEIRRAAFGAQSAEAAESLAALARDEYLQADLPSAVADFKAALEAQEKAGAPDDVLAVTLTDYARCLADYNELEAAQGLMDRALAIREKMPGPRQIDLAHALNQAAFLAIMNGDDETAAKLLKRSLGILDVPGGLERPELAYALDLSGNVDLDSGAYPDAEPKFRRALGIFTRVYGPDHQEVANALNDIARAFDDEGRYAEAEDYYNRSIAAYRRAMGGQNINLASVMDNLAQMQSTAGKFREAEANFKRAIAIDEAGWTADRINAAYDYNNLAQQYRELGRYAEAEPLMLKALDIFQRRLPPDHPNIAVILNNLSVLYVEQRDFAKAEPYAKRSLEMGVKALGPDNPQVSTAYNSLAQVYEGQGRYAEAEPLYIKAYEIVRKALGPGHPLTGEGINNLANLYDREGKFAQADKLFPQALAVLRKAYGPRHPRVQETLTNYAGEQYAEGRDPAKAGALFDESLGLLHSIYEEQFAYMNEQDRLQYFARSHGDFQIYYSFCLKNHAARPELAGKMYDVLLWQKGLVGNSIAALRAKIAASGDPEALDLLEKLSASKTRLANLINNPDGDRAAWQKAVDQQQKDADDLERRLLSRSGALAQDRKLQAVTWRDVQKALKPGEAAVEMVHFQFEDGQRFTDDYYYVALVLTPRSRGPQFVVLGKSRDLESAPVADYAARIRKFGAAGGTAFYGAFWRPLEAALGKATRVYLAADGMLNQASLGIVADGQGRLLMERYDLRLVTSSRDLLRPAYAGGAATAVLVGGPHFDLPPGQYLAAVAGLDANSAHGQKLAQRGSPDPDLAMARDAAGKCPLPDTGVLCPLPGAAAEVDGIGAELTRARWQPTLYRDDQALEEAVKQVRHPRVLHLATHGFFLPDQKVLSEDPMLRSGLYFAGADNTLSGAMPPEGADDGVLTAYEATQLDLEGTELVVLSACDTGLGSSQSGEGVFGLNRALQEAGAQAVLMSMWSVPDQETRELMQLFYKNWLGGMEKHEALRQAELAERDVVKQRYGHDLPYYWGAFVMVGR
ncbi:MAG TPA: CHAT domain-containing tetratricopeptide repeat protein [Gammaproteobacteria bacterium]